MIRITNEIDGIEYDINWQHVEYIQYGKRDIDNPPQKAIIMMRSGLIIKVNAHLADEIVHLVNKELI